MCYCPEETMPADAEKQPVARRRILVIEDEPSIADNILYSLETEGYEAEACATGREALAGLSKTDFSLVVLDIGLPDISGFDLFRQLRDISDVPVIFLTARSTEVDRVVGLEMGGDDYMVKPFSPRELTARIRAVLRRTEKEPTPRNEEPGGRGESPGTAIHIDQERMQIAYFGQPLDLSRNEFRLVQVLSRHPGRVYSRAQLMDLAWEEPEAAMERTVDAHVKSLRAKFKSVRAGIDPIQTHRGFGYSFRDDL